MVQLARWKPLPALHDAVQRAVRECGAVVAEASTAVTLATPAPRAIAIAQGRERRTGVRPIMRVRPR